MRWLSVGLMLGLAACGPAAQAPNTEICNKYGETKRKALEFNGYRLDDQGKKWWAMYDCLHTNALRLAQGSDGADTVAHAVVEICHFETAATADVKPGDDAAMEVAAALSYAEGQARIFALEARAGHCPVPQHSN